MKKLYSKFVENKVTQHLLAQKLIQKLSALPRRESALWKQAVPSYPQPAPVFWAR